jgi:predicted O-methyltransferase YrrM/GR25 family glycosyltransferase involved in LPS biosynthesis
MSKIEGLPAIHFISLEESVDRRNNLQNWFDKYNITNYVSHLFKRFAEYNHQLVGPFVHMLAEHSKGPITSHFCLLKELYETYDDEYFLIAEDDLSLEPVEYWNFTWQEFYENLPEDWNCVQLLVIKENECDNYYFQERENRDWCAGAYLIKREYIKLLIELYYPNNIFNLDIKDLIYPPIIEHLLFTNKEGVYCFPLFVEDCYATKSSLLPENAHAELINGQGPNHHSSYHSVMNWWKNTGKLLTIDQIKKGKMNHIYQEPQFGEDWFGYPNLYTQIIKKFPSGSNFVEIGSWKGKSSAFMAVEIANSYKNINLYCVDTWEGSVEHQGTEELNSLYNIFSDNMKPLTDYHIPLRMTSLEAAKQFENNSLDFVFIDASHEYEDVKNDINAWFPKVKNGGIIAGHDYYVTGHDYFPGVKKAVNEIFDIAKLKFDEGCWIYEKSIKENKDISKVLFLGRNSKSDIWEYDFISNKILPSNIYKQDYFMTLNDVRNTNQTFDVLIYSARDPNNYCWGWMPSYEEVLECVLKVKPKIIIQLSDEFLSEDLQQHNELATYCELFLRQHHHPNYKYYTNTLHIPLGYINGFNTEGKDIRKISNRKLNWSLVGCQKSDRKKCIKHFIEIDNFLISMFDENTLSGEDDYIVTRKDIFNLYNNTIFCPATRGWTTLNAGRIYEAAMCGAIPVIVGSKEEIDSTFKYEENPPCIFATSWEEASNICKELLNDKEKLQQIQDNLLLWWNHRISKIGVEVNKILSNN